jgi:RNase H-fold protein (predicted Holliday junction resolvase)
MIKWDNAIPFFTEYNKHLDEFLQYEMKKARLLNERKIEELSASLAVEQAYIMKTNNFEQRRMQTFGSDKDFKGIIAAAPKEYQGGLTEQYNIMREIIMNIKELSDLTAVTVAERLKKIQRRTGDFDLYTDRGKARPEHIQRHQIEVRS